MINKQLKQNLSPARVPQDSCMLKAAYKKVGKGFFYKGMK